MNIIAISNNLYDKTDIYNKRDTIYIKDKTLLTYDYLKEINPEYVFFPHWSYIIPKKIYENFNCIIFHMTDLPFGRGGSPLQNLLSRGIYNTKISAIKCCEILDGGDVYLKKDFDISFGSAEEIYRKAGYIVSQMIDEIIEKKPLPQKQLGEVVKFHRRTLEESDISDITDLQKIYDYIRMLDAPGYPKAFIKNKNIKYEFTKAIIKGNKIDAKVEIKVENE